jgi:SAM-dependent methyltransferase
LQSEVREGFPKEDAVNDSALPAQIDAASAYEHFFVPALFGGWAASVVDAARLRPGQRVLDVACGTGVLAREAAKRAASVAGLDPDPGMLAVAARLAPGIEWRQGIAESLPWPDQSFDAVLSQFGLMFFTDRDRALREMRRVLAPGGRMAVAVWDSLENTPAYAAEVALLERIAGVPAADALRAPFVLGNPAELMALFAGAGVASVSIATHRGTARFPDVRSMLEADLRGWLPIMGVVLSEAQIGQILEAGEQVLAPYVTHEGAVVFEISAHIVSGINP